MAGTTPSAILGLLLLALSYPGWMLNIKRAHDLDKSGWWLLVRIVVLPVIGGGFAGAGKVASASGSIGMGLLLSLVALALTVVSLWTFIKLFFFNGSPGTNSFGPPSNLLRNALNDEIDVPSAAVPTAARTQAITPAPVAAPRAQASSARPVRGTAASGGGNTRPAGFGRRGLNPA